MKLVRVVQVSIDTAVQPCKDWKVGGMGGRSKLLVGCLWVVVHVVCDGQLLFVSGGGGCSSSFRGFEGVQLLLFMGGHPCSVLWRVIICRWSEYVAVVVIHA